MFQRNKTVPEMIVTDLQKSLVFWVEHLGFGIAYQRPDDGFVYLDLDGVQIMLEEIDLEHQWITGPLEAPLGRGINLQIDVNAVDPIIERLQAHEWPLFKACEEAWYRAGDVEAGQRQFLVQDPDGYLIRLVERLGERPCRLT